MSHFAVLPLDIIQYLYLSLTSDNQDANAGVNGLPLLRLPHPRTGLPALFLPFKSSPATTATILEIQSTAPPDQRSWILGEEVHGDGRMLTMTPVDPLFLLYAILKASGQTTSTSAAQFRTLDDITDKAIANFQSEEGESGLSAILTEDIATLLSLDCSRASLSRLCDVKDITADITVYRYSSTKHLEYLQKKVANLEQSHALHSSRTITRSLAKDGLMEDGKENLLKIARTKASCDLVAQYLSNDIRDLLLATYDFAELEMYLKRTRQDDIDAAVAAPKKGTKKDTSKAAAGDKRKTAPKASVGVEKLKKANVGGMAKLSTFFNKAK